MFVRNYTVAIHMESFKLVHILISTLLQKNRSDRNTSQDIENTGITGIRLQQGSTDRTHSLSPPPQPLRSTH